MIQNEKDATFRLKVIVSDYYGVDINLIGTKTRKREVVTCRHFIHYFLKKYNGKMWNLTLEEMGAITSKDHATVLNSEKVINNLLSYNKEIRQDLENLDKLVRNLKQLPETT